MSLKQALDLASKGFYVFPIAENTKVPAVPFKDQATNNPKKIKMMWTDPLLETEQTYNIGIYTAKFKENKSLVVVDIDSNEKKDGFDSLLDLELEGNLFPRTLSQKTPSGGSHMIYWSDKPVKQGVSVLGPGLDIRSLGGYIVAPGSSIDGKFYKVAVEAEIAECPEWVIKKCGRPEKKEFTLEENLNIDQSKVNKRAIRYLKNEAPESVKGDGGDQTAYFVACRLKDFGVTENDALHLMMDHWFEGSGWSPDKLQTKIENAYKYGKNPVGSATAEYDFRDLTADQENKLKKNGNYLKQMNKDHALIFIEGQHAILHETRDEKGRSKHVIYNEASFKRKFSPYQVQEGRRYISWAEKWLDWKGRRTYWGVIFAPERPVKNGYYNLWKGFTCEPLPYSKGNANQKKGFDIFIEHARENVCENEDEFNWLMTYLAHMVQKPWERPLTTLVFRGRKGTGKNALIERVGKLLGSGHFLVADDSRYLTSNFNGHLDSCLMLVLDEAFWSGDKKAEGKLKGLTTGSEILIERKGKEVYAVDNLARLVVMGNEAWVVPATEDERRYMVFTMGDGRRLDTKYFLEMRTLLDEKGGNRILLDYLKNYDISKININIPIATRGLLDQKLETMSPLHQWWNDCLRDGILLGAEFSNSFDKEVIKERVRDAFHNYISKRNIKTRIPNDVHFGRILSDFAPNMISVQRRIEGEKRWCYIFPKIDRMRQDWEKFLGQTLEWPDLNADIEDLI